jgi:uncharacterized membrane protein
MLRISSLFSPYKLILHEGKPVTLEVTVKNTAPEKKLVSVTVEVPYDLALNSGGFMRRQEQRIGEMEPDEERTLIFHIFARPTTEPGEYPIKITATEHVDDYTYVASEYTKTTRLVVIP